MRLSPVLNRSLQPLSKKTKTLKNRTTTLGTVTDGYRSLRSPANMPAHQESGGSVVVNDNSHNSHDISSLDDSSELTDDEILEQFKMRFRRRLSSTTEEVAHEVPQSNSPRRSSLDEIASVSLHSSRVEPTGGSGGGSARYARRFSTPYVVFPSLSQTANSSFNSALDFEQLKAKLELLTGTVSGPNGKVEGLGRRERRDSMPVLRVKFTEKKDNVLDAPHRAKFDEDGMKNAKSEPHVNAMNLDSPFNGENTDANRELLGLTIITNAEQNDKELKNVSGKLPELNVQVVSDVSDISKERSDVLLPLIDSQPTTIGSNLNLCEGTKPAVRPRFKIVKVTDILKLNHFEKKEEAPSELELRETSVELICEQPRQNQLTVVRETEQNVSIQELPLREKDYRQPNQRFSENVTSLTPSSTTVSPYQQPIPEISFHTVAETDSIETVRSPPYQQPIPEINFHTVAEADSIQTNQQHQESYGSFAPQQSCNSDRIVLEDELHWQRFIQFQIQSLLYGFSSHPPEGQVNEAVAACRLLRVSEVMETFSQTLESLRQMLQKQCDEWATIKRRHEFERIRMNLLVRQLIDASYEDRSAIFDQIQELASFGLSEPAVSIYNT